MKSSTTPDFWSSYATLPPEIRKKTYLYHYGDDWDAGPFDDVNEKFAGFAQPQIRYRLFE